VTVNDTVKRDALSPADKRRFLEFVRTDPHFSRYYEGIYILFHTGMRISEFCGLTIEDLDMDKGTILISKQLQRVGTRVYIEDQAKTKCGTRIIPMEPMVKEAFRPLLDRRITPAVEPEVDGVRGFLCLGKDGHPMLALHWNIISSIPGRNSIKSTVTRCRMSRRMYAGIPTVRKRQKQV